MATDGCRLQLWLACRPTSRASYCSQTLTLLFQFSFQIDGHAHQSTFAKRWHSCLLIVIIFLDISVVSVVIVAICDIPRQEFSLCECVYIHNSYMKSRKSCSETRCKFRVEFPGRPVPNPSTVRRQAKRFTNV